MNKTLEQARLDIAAFGCCDVWSLFDEIEKLQTELDALKAQEPVVTKRTNGIVLHAGWDDLPDGTELYAAPVPSVPESGWKEAAIAWNVCASIHREWAKGKDALYSTRQSDFIKHAEYARTKALSILGPSMPEERLQCWSADDPEHGAFDPTSMAEYFADNMYDDESHVFDVLVSAPMPDRKMRVTLGGGEERELHWEWVEEPKPGEPT